MTDLLEPVRATGLLPGGQPVVVLLSGGRDSVCLLDCAVRLAGGGVSALHIDHGLRAAAAEDEEHCRALCDLLSVELVVERVRRPEGPGNLLAWAREARYAAARRVAAHRNARVATGHTASDQAETVLYRLAASPGRRALLGMTAREDGLVRPLLGVTRAQTTAHCQARGLTWREDATNDDQAFARARVRGGLLPALTAIHPGAEINVVRTAALLREEAAVLDQLVAEVLAPRGDRIARDRLAGLPAALARLVLRRLAEATTGRLCPRVPGRLEEVMALREGGALDLGEGARATVRGGVLTVQHTPVRPSR
ncbi:MAG TPA: tRNA lysidine(34) synthetase TilS [Solirubrobacteraceae bacterium]|nr:tRNA lysidine(34) synthetase TilS [Solirubrobacteraceae bacterium]